MLNVTCDTILCDYAINTVTLLQIDTEGFDLEVIKLALKTKIIPSIINYEHANLSVEDRLKACRLLTKYGYRFLHGRWDTLAVRIDDGLASNNVLGCNC